MRIKFTKASRKDSKLVTINLSQLQEAADYVGLTSFNDLSKDSEFYLTVYRGTCGHRNKLLFRVNRAGKTAVTTGWITDSNRPSVGKAVTHNVSKKVVLL